MSLSLQNIRQKPQKRTSILSRLVKIERIAVTINMKRLSGFAQTPLMP